MHQNLTYSIDNGGGASTFWNIFVVIVLIAIIVGVVLLCRKIIRSVKSKVDEVQTYTEKKQNRQSLVEDICHFINQKGGVWFILVDFRSSMKASGFTLINPRNGRFQFNFHEHGYENINDKAAQEVFQKIARAYNCHYRTQMRTLYDSSGRVYTLQQGVGNNVYLSSYRDPPTEVLAYIELYSQKAWQQKQEELEREKNQYKKL